MINPGRRWLVLVFVPALLLGFPQPAHAHARLVTTDPTEGAVLPTAPDRVRFTFDEAVRGVPGGVQVFDPQGRVVKAEPTVRGAELDVVLSAPPGRGTTVVTWRVASEDGHPISGALTFSVGAPSPVVTPPPSDASSVPDVPVTLTLARGLGYVGLLLAAGLVAFNAFFLPAGPRRRVVRVARGAAVVAAIAWLAAVPLTASYLLGGGPGLLTQALPPTEYVVTATVVCGLAVAVSVQPRAAAVVAAAFAVTAPALVGHTRAASPELLVIGADALHLLAGGVWLGGLAGLALTLPALSGRGAAEVLARFSTAAAGVLVALVATGPLLAWRILESWEALFTTTYGQLLLAKIGIVLVVVGIAAWNRWMLLPRSTKVVRTTAVEGALILVALLVTAFLVDTSPERDAKPVGASTGSTTTLGGITVRASLTPLTRGPNTLTLRLSSEGVAPPVVRLSSDGATLGDIPLTQVSAGFYTAPVTLPVAGTWRMQVSLRVSQFTNPVGELEFVVP